MGQSGKTEGPARAANTCQPYALGSGKWSPGSLDWGGGGWGTEDYGMHVGKPNPAAASAACD